MKTAQEWCKRFGVLKNLPESLRYERVHLVQADALEAAANACSGGCNICSKNAEKIRALKPVLPPCKHTKTRYIHADVNDRDFVTHVVCQDCGATRIRDWVGPWTIPSSV